MSDSHIDLITMGSLIIAGIIIVVLLLVSVYNTKLPKDSHIVILRGFTTPLIGRHITVIDMRIAVKKEDDTCGWVFYYSDLSGIQVNKIGAVYADISNNDILRVKAEQYYNSINKS